MPALLSVAFPLVRGQLHHRQDRGGGGWGMAGLGLGVTEVDGATKKLPMLVANSVVGAMVKPRLIGVARHLFSRWFFTAGNSLFLFRFSSLQT